MQSHGKLPWLIFMSHFPAQVPTRDDSESNQPIMKTNLSILCFVSLLLCGCGEKSDRSSAERGTRGGVLLTTDLPPELIEGTQLPIILPQFTPMPSQRQ